MNRFSILAFAMMTLIGGCKTQSQAGGSPLNTAGIPLGEFDSIRDWRGEGDGGVYLESSHRTWYHATFTAPCLQLPSASHISVGVPDSITDTMLTSIQVYDHKCYFKTFDPVSGPPGGA